MSRANADQEEFWSDIAGPKWIAQQVYMDKLMQPVLDAVLARAALEPGDTVLDIGCGAGASSIAAADRVGSAGHVLGADISRPLLDLAERRAAGIPNIEFLHADAETHPFEPAAFDHLLSRFGVMFFAHSETAFANMALALRPGARLTCAAWGAIAENPFFTHAAQAARGVLGQMPRTDPDAPGPFAFRDPDRVCAILSGAGLQDADVEPVTVYLDGGQLPDFVTAALAIGPAEAAIAHFQPDAAQRDAVRDALEQAYAPFDTSDGLRIPASINLISAHA